MSVNFKVIHDRIGECHKKANPGLITTRGFFPHVRYRDARDHLLKLFQTVQTFQADQQQCAIDLVKETIALARGATPHETVGNIKDIVEQARQSIEDLGKTLGPGLGEEWKNCGEKACEFVGKTLKTASELLADGYKFLQEHGERMGLITA